MAFVPQQQQHQRQHQRQQRQYYDGGIHPISSIVQNRSKSPNSPLQLSSVKDPSDFPPSPPINTSLIRQLILNQSLLGYTIWTHGIGYTVLTRDAIFTSPLTFIPLALLGVLPLLALSNTIENSESPLVSTLNLSTDVQMLRIFGPKPRPLVALAISTLLAALTGLVEEVTFRGEILPTLSTWSTTPGNLPFPTDPSSGVYYGILLSTLIFAALHVNPQGLFRAPKDALVLFGLQMCTGATFAGLYVGTGNLAVPIVAHGIYDLYTFYKTHLVVTNQMEYAAKFVEGTGEPNGAEKFWTDERGADFVREARQTFYLMDTNKDGVVSREELRIAMYSYGIELSKGESEGVLEVADVDRSGGIDFEEFLGFMGPEGQVGKAIKVGLLGVL